MAGGIGLISGPDRFVSTMPEAFSSFSESPSRSEYDAVVVGSGPNGLAAGITLARAGKSVLLVEGKATPGGGTRSKELTRPGFVHDVCSAIHPMALASPFFRGLDLESGGLAWVQPEFPVVHPLDDGKAVVQERAVDATAERLGRDGAIYRRLFGPLTRDADKLYASLLGPLGFPRHPIAVARFGACALFPAQVIARGAFETEEARALFAGHAGHSVLPFHFAGTAAFGFMLGVSGHAVGWPIPVGGSQSIANALVRVFEDAGGELICNAPVTRIEDLPAARAYVMDVAPPRLAEIAGNRLPERYRSALRRYRYGPGAFKVDWALSAPIPWTNPDCARTACVHVGGTFSEVAESEAMAWKGRDCERPFLILAQPSLFDETRAPAGQHTAWAYCHIPHGSTTSYLEVIESQIERFAPGFRDCVLERHVMGPADLEQHNPNLVGGDVIGGAQDLRQLYARPAARPNPYTTPAPDIFIGSASTPPGAGVHGMCGYHAARAALARIGG